MNRSENDSENNIVGGMMKIFRSILLVQLACYFVLAGLVVLLGCASAKYKEAEKLYDNGEYQQLIQLSMDCSDFSANCFQIKLLQADSHYQLGNLEKALKYSQEALDRQDKVKDVKSINQLHLLRANIIFELLPEIHEFTARLQVLHQLETQLKLTLDRNSDTIQDSLLISQRQELMKWLEEALLAEMDLAEVKDLEPLFQEIRSWSQKFPENMQSKGYSTYYLLQGELKSILPQVKSWSSRGIVMGDREQLLEKLKSIYLQAITLRRLPLYEEGYDEKIDLFLSQLDQYMKGLVL
jgi:tetratricopeptide (TPR) repeat protein